MNTNSFEVSFENVNSLADVVASCTKDIAIVAFSIYY